MAIAMPPAPTFDLSRIIDAVRPKEHGSWSLALEPIVFALIVAPSRAGMVLAIAVLAGFFARRPLRMMAFESDPSRRRVAVQALGACGVVAVTALGFTVAMTSLAWLVWIVPSALGGVAFVIFDLQRAGREQAAEIAGSGAFAWLPAVFAIVGGFQPGAAVALAAVMMARALPTVLVVRATIRARKAGGAANRWPLAAAIVAALGVGWLVRVGAAPAIAVVGASILAMRAYFLLVFPRPTWRASTIGLSEVGLGAAYVFAIGLAW